MQKIHAAITAVGGYVPEYVLTNAELETMMDTTDEWIQTRTGIKERRILKGEGKGSSDMAVEAVKMLLEKTQKNYQKCVQIFFHLCLIKRNITFKELFNFI